MDQANEPKYDVAISFLVEDLPIAEAIYQQLSASLSVFFFPHNQEELAGTNGLESMRAPFVTESRLNVVIYREKWGHTPWTGVESTAIQEACLQSQFENIFMFMVDSTSKPPKWLPKTHVRFNHSDFSLDQAVGAIKARVQDLGGKFAPLTPTRKAELFAAKEKYRRDKTAMASGTGEELLQASVESLFSALEKHCEEITNSGHMELRFAAEVSARNANQTCAFSNLSAGVSVLWSHPYTGSLEKAELIVRFFGQRLLIGPELRTHMYFDPPKPSKQMRFIPDLSMSREYGWRLFSDERFLSNLALAEQVLLDFMDFAAKRL